MMVLALQHANAASAMVKDGHGHLISSRKQSTNVIATQHALATARQRYGANVRLLAACDVEGYCAIAVAREGRGFFQWKAARQWPPWLLTSGSTRSGLVYVLIPRIIVTAVTGKLPAKVPLVRNLYRGEKASTGQGGSNQVRVLTRITLAL
jgi:hypothetical protein